MPGTKEAWVNCVDFYFLWSLHDSTVVRFLPNNGKSSKGVRTCREVKRALVSLGWICWSLEHYGLKTGMRRKGLVLIKY
jgi:hypothetical protein